MLLARRRLLQISVFDSILVTTGVIALIVNFQALAPRGFIYTTGFFGGLLGTAVAMNRSVPRWWEILCLGAVVGVAGGWLGAAVIEALYRGVVESPWHWYAWRGRVAPTNYATGFGATGGLAASILYGLLCDLNTRNSERVANAQEQRERSDPE
jgi:hypothetical protein